MTINISFQIIRPFPNIFAKFFARLAYVRNETVNIYSHLILAILLSLFSIPQIDTSSTIRQHLGLSVQKKTAGEPLW